MSTDFTTMRFYGVLCHSNDIIQTSVGSHTMKVAIAWHQNFPGHHENFCVWGKHGSIHLFSIGTIFGLVNQDHLCWAQFQITISRYFATTWQCMVQKRAKNNWEYSLITIFRICLPSLLPLCPRDSYPPDADDTHEEFCVLNENLCKAKVKL